MIDRPSAVLFVCTLNAFRSPMAEALVRRYYGRRIYVQSCGVRPEGTVDPMVVQVMDEIGADLSSFRPKSFWELDNHGFDLIITLSPEAHHHALELTRTEAVEVRYWPTMDPTIFTGSRQQVLEGFRMVRDSLARRIRQTFGSRPAPAP